jgi:hypothetical protein
LETESLQIELRISIQDHPGLRVDPTPNDCCPYETKREIGDTEEKVRGRRRQIRPGHKPREWQGLPAPQKLGKRQGTVPLDPGEGIHLLLISDF